MKLFKSLYCSVVVLILSLIVTLELAYQSFLVVFNLFNVISLGLGCENRNFVIARSEKLDQVSNLHLMSKMATISAVANIVCLTYSVYWWFVHVSRDLLVHNSKL